MIVCVCINIDMDRINEIIKLSDSFEDFKIRCKKEGIGESCGVCLDEVYENYENK